MGYIDIINLIVVGKSHSGKSVLVKRFVSEFSGIIYDPTVENITPTITNELTKIEVKVDNKLVELRFWDTVGQERFDALSSSFYRNADGVLICYDISDQDSWNAVPYYLQQVNKYCNKDVVVTLVGNKND